MGPAGRGARQLLLSLRALGHPCWVAEGGSPPLCGLQFAHLSNGVKNSIYLVGWLRSQRE